MNREEIMSKGYFYEFQKSEISDLNVLGSQGFEFDWTIPYTESSRFVSFIYEGQILGMIEFLEEDNFNFINLLEVSVEFRNMGIAGRLVSFVAKDAFEKGFEGFMLAISKTSLREFYITKLGGEQIGGTNRIRFTTEASLKIIEKYGGE